MSTIDNKWGIDEDTIEGQEGFVYQISNEVTGKFYIGRKSFWRRAKGKIAGVSDWKAYCGSSRDLKADMESDKDNWHYQTLEVCDSKSALNYKEIRWQVNLGCLETELCYNRNLGNTKVFYTQPKKKK